MERSLGLFGHELKPVSYFFCVFFLEKRNIFSFSLLKKTHFWCLLPVSGRFTPPSDPSSTTSLRMSWDYHSKQYFDRRGRELPNERERFLDLFDQLGKSISSWLWCQMV